MNGNNPRGNNPMNGGQPNPMQMMAQIQQNGGIQGIMLEDSFQDQETGHTFSQADIIADIINVLRMDTKRIAEEVGLEVEISQMTPERAAELLVQTAQGQGLELIEMFDEISEQRMRILNEVTNDEYSTDEWEIQKMRHLYSASEQKADMMAAERGVETQNTEPETAESGD